MKLKSFSYILGLLIISFFYQFLSEEKIDIWKNQKETIEEDQKREKYQT